LEAKFSVSCLNKELDFKLYSSSKKIYTPFSSY